MSEALRKLGERFGELDRAFTARTMRERLVLAVSAIVVLAALLDSAAIQPAEAELDRLEARIRARESERPALEGELAVLSGVELTEEGRRLASEREQIEMQLAQIESRVAESLSRLVPPEAVVSLLEEVLAETPAIRLVHLESRPPEELGVRAASDPERPPTRSGLFRHGLRIELEGPYPRTVDYLERLEASSWHLLWDRFDYEVEAWPTGRVTIDLHTISDRQEWIGV